VILERAEVLELLLLTDVLIIYMKLNDEKQYQREIDIKMTKQPRTINVERQ
jgi:hypothetical protein